MKRVYYFQLAAMGPRRVALKPDANVDGRL